MKQSQITKELQEVKDRLAALEQAFVHQHAYPPIVFEQPIFPKPPYEVTCKSTNET